MTSFSLFSRLPWKMLLPPARRAAGRVSCSKPCAPCSGGKRGMPVPWRCRSPARTSKRVFSSAAGPRAASRAPGKAQPCDGAGGRGGLCLLLQEGRGRGTAARDPRIFICVCPWTRVCRRMPVGRSLRGRFCFGFVLLKGCPSVDGRMTIFRGGQRYPDIRLMNACQDELRAVFSVPTTPY